MLPITLQSVLHVSSAMVIRAKKERREGVSYSLLTETGRRSCISRFNNRVATAADVVAAVGRSPVDTVNHVAVVLQNSGIVLHVSSAMVTRAKKERAERSILLSFSRQTVAGEKIDL